MQFSKTKYEPSIHELFKETAEMAKFLGNGLVHVHVHCNNLQLNNTTILPHILRLETIQFTTRSKLFFYSFFAKVAAKSQLLTLLFSNSEGR